MSSKVIPTKLISIIMFCMVCVTFIYSRLRFMDIPLDRDEGSYLYMGFCFFKGYIPYVDFYEIKPPGIFLIYGLFHLIFGYSNFLLHLGLLLTQLCTAWLIYRVVVSLFHQAEQGLLAASIYFVFNLYPNFMSFGILSEHFFVLFLLLSMDFLIKTNLQQGYKNIFLSGLFFGVAAMIRQHAIFFVVPMLVFILYLTRKNNKIWHKNLLYFIFGSIFTVFLLIGYVSLRGGFDEMIYWVYTHPSEKYITRVTWAEGQKYLYNYINHLFIEKHYPMLVFLGFGLILCVKDLLSKEHGWKNLVILLFFIGAVMTVFPGNRFYGHYWLMLFPFLAIVAGRSLVQISHKGYRLLTVVCAMVLFINQFYLNGDLYFKIPADRIYQRLYKDNPNYSLKKITGQLKRKLKKEDKIFVFGSEPQVYYETKKILALPHVFIGFLNMPSDKALEDQKSTISYLEQEKPEFIVHLQNSISLGMKENSHQNLYQWIFSFENQYYEKIALADINDQNMATYYFDHEANKTPSTTNYIILYQLKKDR